MTTDLEDDVRAALRQRAETHAVVVPDLDDLVAAPLAAGGPTAPRRRVLVAVAAAALVVVAGVAAVSLTADEPSARARVLVEPPPTPGTHGAVLVGHGPPVDATDAVFGPPAEELDRGMLVVLGERSGEGTAVVAFTLGNGASSFDVPPLEGGTPLAVGGRPATLHPPTHFQPHLAILRVEQDGGRSLFVGGIGLDDADLVTLAEAALVAGGPEGDWWSDGWVLQYGGPDANPFAWLGTSHRSIAYEVDGDPVAAGFRPGGADPADYAWYLPDASVQEVDGRRIVRWSRDGRTSAAWLEAGGMVSVSAPADRLDQVIDATVVVDEDTWEAERASVTAPGSRYSSGTTEAIPATTTG